MSCPSRLELSRWEASPALPAEVDAHVASCEKCGAVLGNLRESRNLLLGGDPAQASLLAARLILGRARERQDIWRRFRRLVPLILVPAAAALLVLGRPHLAHQAISVKGRLIMETYCKRGEQVFLASDGGDYKEGDQLRFAYTQDRAGFLLVFAVDDTGQVFPYYQEGALVGSPVAAGARVLLPGSVELDGHHGWERIFMLWSPDQFVDSAVRGAVASARAASGGDVRRISSLDLPVEQVSLVLRRP